MNALTEKRYLMLPKPAAGEALALRERLLAALPEGCRLTFGCMQQLYPALPEADYCITVTLCPGEGGTDVVRVEPGGDLRHDRRRQHDDAALFPRL